MNHNNKISFETLYPIIKEELGRGNSFTFTAFGRSMHPTIRGGVHRVTLSPISEELEIGDILFYRRTNGMFVLHRLCKISTDGSLVFCGDNQFTLEKGILREQVIAKMTKLQLGEKDVTPSPKKQKISAFFLPIRRFYLHAVLYLKRIIKHFIHNLF